MCLGKRTPAEPAFAAAFRAIACALRSYLRSLNPQLPRDVWILQAGERRFAGVRGTMANMAPTTDEPLSTDAQPAPHPADEASRIR